MSVVGKSSCMLLRDFRGSTPKERATDMSSTCQFGPIIIKNSPFDARGRVESGAELLRKINHERIDVETPRRYVFSSPCHETRRASALLLMVLPLLRHKRVHDLLHRFSQIVRATGSHGRYCPRFHSRGRRYAARGRRFFRDRVCERFSEEKEINSIVINTWYIKKKKKDSTLVHTFPA